jgi:hypothetical protein
MSSLTLEDYLARLYTDAAVREKFLMDPAAAARDAGLSASDTAALRNIDIAGLKMAAASYAHKREQHRRPRRTFYETWMNWLHKRLPFNK